jgi:hypothetical protein
MSSEQEQLQNVDKCVTNTYNQLRTYSDPDSLYSNGIYDRQMAEQMCVEGFGCGNKSGNFDEFIIILLVIAVIAYFLSTHTVQQYNLGLGVQSGGSYIYRPSFSDEVKQILGLRHW